MFSATVLHPAHLRRLLGRPLTGSVDDRLKGEHAILRALNEGDYDGVRAVLARTDPLVGEDFTARVRSFLAAAEQKQSFRYEIDVPAKVWHEAAKTGRVDGRSFRRVLADYLVRGWEAYSEERREVASAREALREDVRAFRADLRSAITEASRQAAADVNTAGHALEEVLDAIGELRRYEHARSNAIVAVLAALHQRKWIPTELLPQLRRDGWID